MKKLPQNNAQRKLRIASDTVRVLRGLSLSEIRDLKVVGLSSIDCDTTMTSNNCGTH